MDKEVKSVRYIGDVHGKYRQYRKIIKEVDASIQVGDMGVGFYSFPHRDPQANPPHDLMVQHNARFIRGNHDNPAVCKNQTQWIPDGYYDPATGTMFIGGADSIDKALRIKDYSWWDDEELDYSTLNKLVDSYEDYKPRIMVTHDAPYLIAAEVIRPMLMQHYAKFEATRTRQAFQQMFQLHQPELWIFGHYHVSFDHTINGTRFICLAELEYKDIEL